MPASLLATTRAILSGLLTPTVQLDEARSHSDIRRYLQAALREETEKREYTWVQDVLDDGTVVYSHTDQEGIDKLFLRPYSLDENDNVSLGDPVEVRIQTEYVPVEEPASESATTFDSELVPLTEATRVRADGSARIKIIQPGWGSSGYYSEQLLKDSAPLFSEGTHLYLDHPSRSEAVDRPERSVRDLAGTMTSEASYEEHGSHGPGLYADVKFREDLAGQINEIAPHVGMSIRAMGTRSPGEADGQAGMLVDSIADVESCDVVTIPGAGGAITELMESIRIGKAPQEREPEMPEETTQEKGVEVDVSADMTALQEQMAAVRQELLESKALAFVQAHLADKNLPAPVRNRLTARLSASPVLDEAGAIDVEKFGEKIDEAINEERAYLAEVAGNNGQITGMGGGLIETDDLSDEDVDKQLEEAFIGLTGDEKIAAHAIAGRD